jgi:hypothetical protein
MNGTRWRNPPPQKTCCLADAMDMSADELARTVLPGPTGRVVLTGRIEPSDLEITESRHDMKPPRSHEEILHDIERLAYDTRQASLDPVTQAYRELEPAVLTFTSEKLRRLVVELAGVQP